VIIITSHVRNVTAGRLQVCSHLRKSFIFLAALSMDFCSKADQISSTSPHTTLLVTD